MAEPSVAHLRQLDDGPVICRAQEVFRHQLRACDSVRPVFFPQTPPPPVPPDDPDWIDELAVALVCSSIAASSPHGLARRVDERRCVQAWDQALDPARSPDARRCGQALYEWAFPSYCTADGLSFGSYLGQDGADWGNALADDAVGQRFIDELGARVAAADPRVRHELDLLLYKLSRLAPQRLEGTLECWRRAFPEQSLGYTPPGSQCLAPSMFTADAFLPAVIAALGGHRMPAGTDGVQAVSAFLDTRAAALAARNDDPEPSRPRPFVGCFLPGTPVLVLDGDEPVEVPIEQVGAGDAVISGHGTLSRCTAEAVQIPLLHDEVLFGINDDPPFFSAGHPFLTPDGWRAVDPAIARAENPDREVAPLRVGDRVYLARGGPGIDHQAVSVDRITRRTVPAGGWLYGLHLDGDPTYHARGYCVGANYPVFTERRLAEGFALLSPAERTLVREALADVMPLLTLALGPFLQAPLLRALSGGTPRRPPTPRTGFTGPQARLHGGAVPAALP